MDAESLAEFLEAAAACVVAVRLLHLGLAKSQPALVSFLVFTAVSLFTLGSLPLDSRVYFWLYVDSTVVSWVASVYVVREMFALAFHAYPGIRTAGRWTLYGATGIAAVVSFAISVLFWNGGAHGRSHLFYVQVMNRSIVLSLAVIIAAIVLFLSRYPLHLHRNTYVSTSFFSAVFLSEAAAMLIDSVRPHLYSTWVDSAQLGFAGICFVAWAIMLKTLSAATPVRVSFGDPREHELLLELESLNSLLARAGRR